MKKFYSLFILGVLCSFIVNAQLTGVIPNQAIPGQVLQTTITGNGIFVQSGSPTGNLYQIKLVKGPDVITLFDYDTWAGFMTTTITDPNTVVSELQVPVNAVTGVYDLNVITGDIFNPWWNQALYTLPGAFTIASPDGYITGTAYKDLNKNGVKDAGEPGISNRQMKLLPNNTTVNTDGSGNFSYPVVNGNYSVVNINSYFDYYFLTSGTDTIPVTINNGNSSNNNFGLSPALVSISPDTVRAGTLSSHIVIADEPIFTTGANPYGNISSVYVYSNPGYTVPLASAVTVISNYSAQIDILLPSNVITGSAVDIRFIVGNPYSGYHFLRNKLIVAAPDGLVRGNIFYDVNNNGIKDAGEIGISSSPVKLLPQNATTNTNAIGDYSFGVSNGSHSITPLPSFSNYMYPTAANVLPFTINNDTVAGINFGMKPALISVTPNFGYKGLTTLHQFVADKPIFHPGGTASGNVGSVRIFSSPNIYPFVATSVNVIDSFTVRVNIAIPIGTSLASNIDVYFYLNSGATGYHYLRQKFNIINPPSLISGTLFFDQNQNKILDAGEPGISSGKLEMYPDSTFGFSDYFGNYVVASAGGMQTISYANNIPGLSLFTDSASYTFNAAGNITNKNFGLISTNVDYSILNISHSLFARCNTQQFATFKVRNIANNTYNALAWMKIDPQLTFVTAYPAPSFTSNDTLYWNITNLLPYTQRSFDVLFLLPGGGSSVTIYNGARSLNSGGSTVFSDNSAASYNIFCAYDPNDKQVSPAGFFNQHYTLMYDTLKYMVRFQNTGNDTAFNVVILDTLDSHFDYNSFEVLMSSHSMQTQLLKNGALKFDFKSIMLPDSNVNEPASHGYLQYQVKAKAGLPDSTVVYNKAHIYFDFNTDIITNTTFNTLVYVLPWSDPLPIELASFTGKAREKYNDLKWITFSEVNNAYFDLERSNDGSNFMKIATIDGNGTTSSTSEYIYKDYDISKELVYYRLKQVDYDGNHSFSETIYVRRLTAESGKEVLVYPNPVGSQLTILFAQPIKVPVQIEIFDIAGMKVFSSMKTPKEFLIEINADEAMNSKGMYFLKVTTNAGQSVHKIFKN